MEPEDTGDIAEVMPALQVNVDDEADYHEENLDDVEYGDVVDLETEEAA